MSGPPPNSGTPLPFPPYPVQYDEAGNAFVQDATSRCFAVFGHGAMNGPAATLPHPQPMPNVPAAPMIINPPPTHSHNNMQDGPNGPYPYQNNTSAPPVASSSQAIDPTLISLPDGSDDELTDGPTIAKARGHSPARKVAGAHRDEKGKGKAKAGSLASRDARGKANAAPEPSQK